LLLGFEDLMRTGPGARRGHFAIPRRPRAGREAPLVGRRGPMRETVMRLTRAALL